MGGRLTSRMLGVRSRQGQVGAWIGIAGNVLLAAFKLAAGVVAQSKAMVADGMHSASDILASSVVLAAMRVAGRPADRSHPYGHARAESIAAKLVAVILILAGLEILYVSVRSALAGVSEAPGALALWAAVASIVVKEGMFQYKIRLGRRIKSQAIVANAWEHRSDAFSSLASLVGILGARLGWPLLDPVAGAVVSLFVVKMGWDLLREAIDSLMDRAAGEAMIRGIEQAAQGVPGVEEVRQVRTRALGQTALVDLEIAVSPDLKVSQGHRVADQVRDAILDQVPEVAEVLVHVDPAGHGAPAAGAAGEGEAAREEAGAGPGG
ncbi:MAG: cation diffusion facilitator family transporter [Acetobacteraceae bacterium]|nr:cation diffusion facilitator family transporter [Acetobacteraceae bacterium]